MKHRRVVLSVLCLLVLGLVSCGDKKKPTAPGDERTASRFITFTGGGTIDLEGVSLRIPAYALAVSANVVLSLETSPNLDFADTRPLGPVCRLDLGGPLRSPVYVDLHDVSSPAGGEVFAFFDNGETLGMGRQSFSGGRLTLADVGLDPGGAGDDDGGVVIWAGEREDLSDVGEPLHPDWLGIHHFGRRVHDGEELYLLIHGISSSHEGAWQQETPAGVTFQEFVEGLAGENGIVWGFQYDPYRTIETSSDLLYSSLIALLGEVKPRLTIIAHSMGGIVARHFLKNHADDFEVGHLVLLGSPHGGMVSDSCRVWEDYLGRFSEFVQLERSLVDSPGAKPTGLLGPGARQLVKGSAFLEDLNQGWTEPYDINALLIAGEQEGRLSACIEGPDDGLVSVESAVMGFEPHETYSAAETTLVAARHEDLTRDASVLTAVQQFLGAAAEACVPEPISPKPATVMANNCHDWPDSAVWEFEWHSCPGAERYHLQVDQPDADIPEFEVNASDLSDTSYQMKASSGWVEDAYRFDWSWRVRAMTGGIWGEWSTSREFAVKTSQAECPYCEDLSAPSLFITGTEELERDGEPWTRWRLSITNYRSYRRELFSAAPHLEPCGEDDIASRVKVGIYGNTGEILGELCHFTDRDQLYDGIWFDLPAKKSPPDSIYVVLTDRYCGVTATSNRASTDYGRCYPDMPAPELGLLNVRARSGRIEFELTVTNLDEIPPELFAPATDLPPCGMNTSSSRTWVDVYAQRSWGLNSYCGLGLEDFESITVSHADHLGPVEYLYMIWTDRRCNDRIFTTTVHVDWDEWDVYKEP